MCIFTPTHVKNGKNQEWGYGNVPEWKVEVARGRMKIYNRTTLLSTCFVYKLQLIIFIMCRNKQA